MSYGVWRKRGKGWCSVEIDSPWNGKSLWDMRHENPAGYSSMMSLLDRAGVFYDDWSDDVIALRFEANHTMNGRKIAYDDFGSGEHTVWIAYDNDEALLNALKVRNVSVCQRQDFLRKWEPHLTSVLPRVLDKFVSAESEEDQSWWSTAIQRCYGRNARIDKINQVFGHIDGKHDWHKFEIDRGGFGENGKEDVKSTIESILAELDGREYEITRICVAIDPRSDDHSYVCGTDFDLVELVDGGKLVA